MKVKKIVLELDKEDIVTILADSTCAYRYIEFDCPTDQDGYEGECYEDKIANVLLNGGYLLVRDLNDYVSIDDYKNGKLRSKIYKHCVDVVAYEEGDEKGVPVYKVTLADLTRACQRINGYKYITALVNGTGDFWDAYNIMQLAMFGEEVYG